MYLSESRLTHLLRPHHYVDPEHHRIEIERLFQPAWHLVGITREIARPGDYITLELFGRPLLVRNTGAGVAAFENVCCHRHCLLTSQPKGHSETLRCQYHGWEYQDDGRTGRIPDAKCFRPWDRENSRLRKFRAETCGELIFVSLAADGPSLADQLGADHERLQAAFTAPYGPAWHWDVDCRSDWKVPVENTLEHYHVPCLHAKTLKTMAPEETIVHEMDERGSSHRTRNYQEWIEPIKNWMVRRLGATPSPDYLHRLIYPNLIYIEMDTFRIIDAFVPTGPGASRQWVYTYSLQGPRRGPLARLCAMGLKRAVRDTVRKILLEDLPIFEQQQRGIHASRHPGVLGTLEGRIHAFHRHVLEKCYPDRNTDSIPDEFDMSNRASTPQAVVAK